MQAANQDVELQSMTKQFYRGQQEGQDKQKDLLRLQDDLLKSKNVEVKKNFDEAEVAKVGYLNKLHFNEVLVEKMRESNADHVTQMEMLRRQAMETELALRQKFADEIN